MVTLEKCRSLYTGCSDSTDATLDMSTVFELSNESFESFKNWRVSNGIREAHFKTTPLVSDDSFLDPLTIVSVVTREQAA